jgi:methionyl-tRNA formyltransferase
MNEYLSCSYALPYGLINALFLFFKAKDPDFLDDLEQNVKPDLCITAAYGQYLPKRFLATPTYGTVNIHPSLLPRWRGASPVQRSLEAGDNPVGVSLLFTVSKMDAGPIISQKEQLIDENDTATIVLPLLFEIGTQLLMDAMPDLLEEKTTMETTTAQDETKIVNADMIDAGQAEFKPWQETARDMHNRLRGFSMWPGAFLYLQIGGDDNDENSNATEPTKFKILETRVLDETVDEPTNVVAPGNTKQDGLRLVCVDGSVLEINKLQPATRKPMDALSFVNGLQGKTARWVKTPVPEEASIV